MKALSERFSCPLVGDLQAETWPAYLSTEWYISVVIDQIRQNDFIVSRLDAPLDSERVVYLLVGDRRRSRLIALNLSGPRGVIYLMEDNGADWRQHLSALQHLAAFEAFTLKELVCESHAGIEARLDLENHRNARLLPPSQPDESPSPFEPQVVYTQQTDQTFN